MSRVAIAVALSVVAAASAAQAQTIGATGETSAAINYSSSPGTETFYANGITDAIHATSGRGGSFEAIVEITASHVSFESGVAVSGPYSSATSRSGVDITVSNGGSEGISIENFASTIIPAGLGFYLQDRVNGDPDDLNVFTRYGQTGSGLTFQNLTSTVPSGIENPFAFADFEFSVTSLESTLYYLSGSIGLYFDGEGQVQQYYNLGDASSALTGFTGVHNTPDNPFAYAFAWDATNIVIPLNAYLSEGQSQVIHYRTSVSAYTRADCITSVTCLVGYSGFGDPIGRGGGVDSVDEEGFSARGFGTFDVGGPITGIVFDPQTFDPFRLISGGAVPEPSTWISMILGFGMLGSAMRRRRTLALARIG